MSGTFRLLEAGSSGHAPEFPLQLEPLLSAVVVAGALVSSVSAALSALTATAAPHHKQECRPLALDRHHAESAAAQQAERQLAF
ncbi:hypothetical protein [Synechococcus sp. BIOS-E4-1]|uniref:hypothetical protein n=1 Tax=Synechococcus sp. BIOS-E4-1 TaxID=1400864 RepID=UPI00164885AB|nr:hypothetical protein [Synechococcus sp. BIOS-E4-1]